ncbi:hypothetical protein CRE_14347 [Caenorhabditis remanei]|uniref:SPK domain-containing protein n=1 Tax=Caenorhabditis remanei TaxID=31234 RepID=E3NIN9_CAERE|nr:hypothetical protein CRE_14347 [Caenorhabditis remanei]
MTCRPKVRKGFMEETNELLAFVIESTKDMRSPVKLEKLCREFKETSGNPNRNIRCLAKKLQTLKIHEMNNLTIDTKVRLIFVLSIPIDPDFFTELQYQANVKIDNHQRIVEYETIGGGLKLSGKHYSRFPETDRKNKRMMMLLARMTETMDYPLPPYFFINEFIAICATSEAKNTAVKRYRELKDKIYWATEYDKVTRMKMMFISGGKVPECFLRELREDALVDVDEKNRIILYQSIDGSLNLQGDHSRSIKMNMFSAHRNSFDIAQLESDEESVEIEEKEETIVDLPSMKRNGRISTNDAEWCPSMRKRSMGDLDFSLLINNGEKSATRNDVMYEEDSILSKRIKEEHAYAVFNNQYIDTIPVQEFIPPNSDSDLIGEIKNEYD